ncbi:3-ketoacyl-CoA synthase 11 [Sesamum angolense]|uniref:very-long-chain 3-oxoacyl-CoA synthase n=1 Tax=Sesamum angolense TaxID=2727404 RepID=A0AAE1X6K8_9LAMI|nr:3-ketoacyl-CoA synthase 11 [Sesamum angolense]
MAEEKMSCGITRSSPLSIPGEEDEKKQANYVSFIRLKYMKLSYYYLISYAAYLLIVPLLLIAAANLSTSHVQDVLQMCNYHLRYNVLTPDPSLSCTRGAVMEKFSAILSEESAAFTKKVLERSGLGDGTFAFSHNDFPPKRPFQCAREEAEMVICGAIDDLFAKSRVKPRDIGILVVNISAFNPTPSLSSMIVNRYKLREDVVQPKTCALIMSLECMTSNYYAGKDRTKLLPNCLFRMGGAAILLSNRFSDRRRSKYELMHTLRTHKGADDRAYKCVFKKRMKLGIWGLIVERLNSCRWTDVKRKYKSTWTSDFKLAFEHFCIHSGGKGVLDEIEKNLQLTQWHMEPSRMTLYRFGNTSSSSIWYSLGYAEAQGRIRKGHRVWQIALGSGFKCNSGVWCALKTIHPTAEQNPWTDEINLFPVLSPKQCPFGLDHWSPSSFEQRWWLRLCRFAPETAACLSSGERRRHQNLRLALLYSGAWA